MNFTEPFVLKNDVVLTPCAELSEEMRQRISFDEGDYTLSRRHARVLAQVIDGETAALLALFRQPRTIADAFFEGGRALGKDPQAYFDELVPHLGVFLENRVLVPPGSEEEQEVRPQYESGAAFAGWEIVRCVSLVEDSEVYQLRNGGDVAALKISRPASPFEGSLFANEAEILRHLGDAGIAPRLIDAGLEQERPYLVIEWAAGVESSVAAAHRRHDRAALIDMAASIAAAYATLHEHGVLHSDVHTRNVLVGHRGEVTLIDFGLSRRTGQRPRVGRGGMYYFYEPEFLAAQRQGIVLPSSAAGEQYALSALLYLLLTGHHYVDFRYEREEMARQAESDPPLPFAARGVPPWPDVEEALFRGLEKEPRRRHDSIGDLAALLTAARDAAQRDALAAPLTAQANEFLETTLASFARGGSVFASGYPIAPKGSISYGAAGAAVGLLRVAETRSDPALLALAAVWSSRALEIAGQDDAYCNPAEDMPRDLVGEVSPYHTESGIHAAAAMVAAAMGDTSARHRAVRAFLAASKRECAKLDLTLGRSATLLGAAVLLPICAGTPDAAALRALGSETMAAVWKELDAHPPLHESPQALLGMAHGWTGYVYAALRWCDESGDALPPRLAGRLHELAALNVPKRRGAYWPNGAGAVHDMTAGWCNGSTGQLFLFTLAHRLLGEEKWLELAELAAWHVWDEARGIASLCCGTAGRAYALLNLYKHTGSREWLSRARQMANDAAANAAATAQRASSLWRGELGAAVLIADLASPENARMPFFE